MKKQPAKGAKAPAKAPAKAAKTPAKAAKTPAKAAKTPAKAPKTPAKGPAKAPAKATGKATPARATKEAAKAGAGVRKQPAREVAGAVEASASSGEARVAAPVAVRERAGRPGPQTLAGPTVSNGAAGQGADGPALRLPTRPRTAPIAGPRLEPRTSTGRLRPPGLPIQTRADRLALTIRRLRRATAVLLVLGLCGFLIDGANRPANPRLVPASDPTAARGSPPFGTATFSVNKRAGAPACVLEAVTPQQQAFGLMGRTSVAPYAGMAFVFGSPSATRFWMKRTVMALSIAWFDASGAFEGQALMPPCPQQVASCPTYGPGRPYSLAIEVPAGRLGSMGIGPGSVAQVGGPCS